MDRPTKILYPRVTKVGTTKPVFLTFDYQDYARLLFSGGGPKVVEVVLKGPFHPLEYNLSSCHRIGSQKVVRVEHESVNSVLLDDQPNDPIDQWSVAAHVGMNPSGTALQARSVTLMPNRYTTISSCGFIIYMRVC